MNNIHDLAARIITLGMGDNGDCAEYIGNDRILTEDSYLPYMTLKDAIALSHVMSFMERTNCASSVIDVWMEDSGLVDFEPIEFLEECPAALDAIATAIAKLEVAGEDEDC